MVVARESNGWEDVEAELLERLEGEEFELFCFDLLKFEAYDRHDGPFVDGPAGRSVPDGGRDILLTVTRPPLTSKVQYQREHHLHPLTEDLRPGDKQIRTAYSCKTGRNWLDLALGDVKGRKTPGRSVEVLLEGGYFKLLISIVEALDANVKRGGVHRTPHEHLAAALWERMKRVKPDAEDPSPRIEILDAHKIASFLQSRRPEGGRIGAWAERLGLVPLLHSLDEWRHQHEEDRGMPLFAADAERKALRDELLAFVRSSPTNPRERAAWLVGAPGVGKTRLLQETLLSDPAIAQRVRVAWSPEEALSALDAGRLNARHPSLVLIVDDCPQIQAGVVASRFLLATGAQPSARVLVVTPASQYVLDEGKIAQRWLLRGLEDDATQTLAVGVLGSAADQHDVQEIVRLSEGYPWFATLLAREARAHGRPPRDLREAARWALASRWEANTERELDALRLRRARCLLAATMTRRVDWDELTEAQRDEVVRAVGLEHWQNLMDEARECAKRGILRRSQGWKYKYVTPLVLEREVIAWIFDPDDGPDPGGRTLARYGQAYMSEFSETLQRLALPAELVLRIAQVGLEDLENARADWGALGAAGLLGPRLTFIARHAPGAVARELRRRIERSSLEELHARIGQRRGIMFALEELVARRDAFEDAEAALFLLAQAENESYANSATATWSNIFHVEINTTYRTLDERLGLLGRRLSEPEPIARAVALRGVQTALSRGGFRRVPEMIDGAWPAPTPDEVRFGRLRAWALLAARFADPDASVASRAKHLATDELRGAVRVGIGGEAMAVIAAHLDDFTEAERVQLRDALAAVRMYDVRWLAPTEEHLRRLQDLLAPTTFRERMHQRIGAWGPAAQRKKDDALDDALAHEGLAADMPILEELDWLLSEQAVRAHVFAYALGRQDEQGVLLTELRQRAKSSKDLWKARTLFARYLGGWAEAGRGAAADAILRELRADSEQGSVLTLAIVELGATDERLRWIEDALRAGQIDGACALELGRRRHWLRGVSDESFTSLAATLVEGPVIEHVAAALEIIVDRLQEEPDRAALPLRQILLRALERLAPEHLYGMTDHYWELGASVLVKQGEAVRVAELAVIALSRTEGSHEHAWKVLHRAAKVDPSAAWRAVSATLDRRDASAGRLMMAFCFHRSSFGWPLEEVLLWVGDDERRGRAVVSLVRPYAEELDPILRALVLRFGPRSSVANEIIARFHSTEGLVSSLAEHDAEQIARARAWLDDPKPEVQTFAERLVESLERSYQQHAAYEEDERLRWGT